MKSAFARSALKPLPFFLIALCLITFSLYKLAHSKDDTTENIPFESNFHGIAINPITDIAVVTNEKADSVSVIDLNTQKVLSTIPVGKAPKGVAIDKGLNIAVVSNSYDENISVLDLTAYQVIANIPVGKSPEGIAVNQLNHTALVANHKDETISVIDLLNYKVIKTIPIGKNPKDIAIDPALNLAVIVSEQRDEGIHTVSVIDLITYQVTAEVLVGKNPQAVDINPETHLAAVANTDDNTITVIDLQTWKTSNIPVGKHPVDVAINQLNNSALVLCYEDKSLFQIDLNTNTIIKEYAIKQDSWGVSVNNFTNIAAATDNKTDSLKLIQLSNPVPHINSVTPPFLEMGISNKRITIEGAQFIKASTVLLQSTSSSYLLNSIFIDNHTLEAEIPQAILEKQGTYQIIVANPPPEGGISNPYEFKIIEPIPQTSAPSPVPLLTSLTPSSIIAGSPDFTLYLTGNNFVKTSIIRFNNQQYQTKYINKTQIEAAIPSSAIKTAGIYPVEVINPAPGGGASNAINLEVKGVSNIPIIPPEDSSTHPPANPETKGSPSLWVGEEKKVIEASTEDGKHLLEIPAKHLEDIAVDNYRGVVWVGTRKEIIQYTLKGQELFRYPLNIKTKDKDDDKYSDCAKGKDKDCDEDNGERVVHISLDYSNGSLWIGAKDEAIKLTTMVRSFSG
ncbi:MAG: IPT/TIG domain-containing protein [Nitrospirota bacterium]